MAIHTDSDVDVLLQPACAVVRGDCHVDTLSLPSPTQLCQSEKTPVELQHISPSNSSHFRTIQRQDSFDMGYEPVISCGRVGSVTVVRPQPRTHSLDLGSHSVQATPLSSEKDHNIANSTPSGLSESCASSAKTNIDSTQAPKSTNVQEESKDALYYSVSLINDGESLASKVSTVSVEDSSTLADTISLGSKNSGVTVTMVQADRNIICAESTNLQQQGTLSEQSEQGSTGSGPVSEGDSGIDPGAEGGEEDGGPVVTDGSMIGLLTNKAASKADGASWATTEESANSLEGSAKVEQQDRKKGVYWVCTL